MSHKSSPVALFKNCIIMYYLLVGIDVLHIKFPFHYFHRRIDLKSENFKIWNMEEFYFLINVKL